MKPEFKILIIAIAVCTKTEQVKSIGNGMYVSITEAPYYASITIPDNVVLCGGAIISEHWAATAGHCVEKFLDRVSDLRLRTGTTTAGGRGSSYNITKVFIHENYTIFAMDPHIHANDIALIRLNEPIVFNEYQQPIQISSKSPVENDTMVIVGLGFEKEGRNAASFKKTELKVLQKSAAPEGNPSSVILTQRDTAEFCDGDSGGPGVINDKLAGIMSYGFGNCQEWTDKRREKYAGALTRVDMFHDWIRMHMGMK